MQNLLRLSYLSFDSARELLTHVHVFHSIALVLHVLPFEKIGIEFPEPPAEIESQYLRITATENILDKIGGL